MPPKRKLVTEPLLVCPYTGQAMSPVYDDDTKHSGWYLEGGFDMTLPFFTKEELYVANTMRGGKKNIAQKLRCPYTGAELKAVQHGVMWFAEGDIFNPQQRRRYKDELLWLCSHRNGVAPDFQKPYHVSVKHADEPHEHFVDTTEGLAHNASDDKASAIIDALIK